MSDEFCVAANNLNFAEIERFKMSVESNLTTRVTRAAITGIGKISTLYVYIQGVFLGSVVNFFFAKIRFESYIIRI